MFLGRNKNKTFFIVLNSFYEHVKEDNEAGNNIHRIKVQKNGKITYQREDVSMERQIAK